MNNNAIFSGPPQRNVYGPLTVGQLFERTFALLRENAGLFFGITLVVIGVEIVVGGALGATGIWTGHYGVAAAPMARMLLVGPLALLCVASIYIITQIIQGALFLATRAKLTGAPMTVGDACGRAAEKAGRLVGISILVALRLIGYMILLELATVVLMLIAFAVSGVHRGEFWSLFHFGHGAALGAGVFLAALLLILFVAYIAIMFWLVVRYAVAIPAALEENLPVTDAIRRSIRLSRGSKGRLVALYLLVAAVSIAIAAITVPLQMMARHGTHSAGLFFCAAAIRILFSWGLIAFMGVATALCYFDLRVRKDGYGSEPAAVTAPPPVPPVLPDWPMEDLPVS